MHNYFMHQNRLTLYRRLCVAFVIIVCSRQEINAQLHADFVMDKSGGCSPVAIAFTNQTTGASANAVYNWDFGNGNKSSFINGGAIYTLEQTYSVTLTVTDGSQTSSKTSTVNVYKNPSVNFSPSVVSGCVPLPVTFTSNSNSGDGSLSSYTWDFGDGNTVTGNSNTQLHTYIVVQSPIISLTVTNSYGCHATLQKTNLINVVTGVSASFSVDKNYVCLISDPVQFLNTSAGPGTLSYNWNFGDGNSSTQKDPQYSFNQKGIYTVSLQVTSSAGCVATDTLSNTLNVASYHTDFTVPTLLCNSSILTFDNNSNPVPDSSIWNVDGILAAHSKDLSYTFNTSGTHAISLTNNFGVCPQTLTKNIVVNDLPAPAGITYKEQGKCGPPEAVTFNDLSNATQHEWDFTYNYYAPNITSTDPQPTYNYPTENVYNIWLRSTNAAGCSITTIQQIFLSPPLVWIYSNGGPDTCGKPSTQTFTCSRTDLTSYLWHFGDGTTSTEVSPTHIYSAVGEYSPYLTYTDVNGCSGTSNSLVVHVSPLLQADFIAANTTVCGNTGIELHGTTNDPNTIYWLWGYGDGQYSYDVDADAIHVYSQPGTYTVTLYVTNFGCTDSIQKTDYITVLPFFSSYTGHGNTCDGDRGNVNFTDSTTGATSIIWNFGDGIIDTTAGNTSGITHHYAQDGNYSMTMTALNSLYQCSYSYQDNVNVFLKQHPQLTADKTVVCTSDILNVTLNNYDLITYYTPNFTMLFQYGDGTPFTGNAQSAYPYYSNEFIGSLSPFEKGEKDLRVITTSINFNCQDTSNFVLLEIKGAKPGFEIIQDHQCLQNPVILKDTSSVDPGNSISSWLWDFGDGSTLTTGGTVSHVYAQPGSYPVKLTVQDASGCSATSANDITSNVSVNGPAAMFSSSGNNVSLNTTVNFYNGTNTYGSLNTIYSWKFSDDGSSSNDYSPSHTYIAAGTFTVTLTSSDPVTGCSSTTSQTIHVSSFNSSFTFTNSYVSGTCPPVLVNFTNTSVNFTRVTWDFGDGVTADSLNNVSHVYKDPGKYFITLTVFGQNGLQEQYIDSIIIRAPAISMATNPLEACIGSTITDTAMSVNAINYTWDFGDGSVTNSFIPKATHQYLSSGIYNPKLIIQDANGCTAGSDLNGQVNIHPNPIATIVPANALICQGSNISLQADGGQTYKWTPALGLSNDTIAAPVASPTTTTIYHLDIADDLGCQNSASLAITVINPGKLQISNDTSVCQGSAVQLNASGEILYNWINNTEGLNDSNIYNPIASPLTTTMYTVTGTDANNCFRDTASVTIHVLPLPIVTAGQDTTVQAGSSFILHGTGSSDVVQWNWTPAKYLSCNDCAMPTCTTNENISYTLAVKTQDGCSSSAHVTIKLECDEARISIPNAFTPNGDGLNDLFVIKGISFVMHMVIYDRWGEKVFERNNFNPSDPASCWNGYFNGMEAATGGYVYFIEMQCPMGGVFSRKGTVMLLR